MFARFTFAIRFRHTTLLPSLAGTGRSGDQPPILLTERRPGGPVFDEETINALQKGQSGNLRGAQKRTTKLSSSRANTAQEAIERLTSLDAKRQSKSVGHRSQCLVGSWTRQAGYERSGSRQPRQGRSRGDMERIERRRHVIDYGEREPFVPFHCRRQRWAVIVAHRRAGKTVATINDKIRRAITSTAAARELCLCRAVPGAGQGGGLGVSQAVLGIGPRQQERKRALGRADQRRAHPHPRRRQPGPAARALSRRRRARRIRRYAPVGMGRGDPPDARRPAGLGDVHRHAQGTQRILSGMAAGAG